MAFQWNLQRELRAHIGNGTTWTNIRQSRRIRLRAMEIGGRARAIAIRLVESAETLDAARDLLNSRYVRKGYGGNHRIPASAHHLTFTAEVDEAIGGTITLAVDSSRGLAADKTFKQELDSVRELPGAKICELTKFAFSEEIHSRELMAALFHVVFVYGYRTHACTHLLIELNPRHVRFYEAMLGFSRLGEPRFNESCGISAQLMVLEVAEIRRQIDCHAGNPAASGTRSLYPLFFSPVAEEAIYERLARAETTRETQPDAATDVPGFVARVLQELPRQIRLPEATAKPISMPRRVVIRAKALGRRKSNERAADQRPAAQ